eukprot:5058479-Pyramimonas_sp.AAC.1
MASGGPSGFIWLDEVGRRFRWPAQVPGSPSARGCLDPGAESCPEVPRCPVARVLYRPIAL